MVQTIIFDFGAVLLAINESLTWKEFEKLGAKKSLREQRSVFCAFEKGEISHDEFLINLEPHFEAKIFRPDLVKAWNALLISPVQSEIITFLKALKHRYTLLLLSNTNALHIKKVRELSGPFRYGQFTKQFDRVYYSHEIGMRKPEKQIFDKVIADNALIPSECLYIDDKKENIEGGEAAGFKTWHFRPSVDTILDLDKVLSAHQ